MRRNLRHLPPRQLVGAAVVVSFSVVLAACGGSPSAKGHHKSSTTTTTSSTDTQSMTVSPSSGLKSGETVKVTASGFSHNEALVLTECANKGKATGAGDCDLSNLKSVESNSSGEVHTTYSVTKGPFGSKKIVCATPKACILSVTQATPSPTQDATAVIAFG